ncbi:MAG: chorismate-binding protein, partial [Thermonemataceae bacterium]
RSDSKDRVKVAEHLGVYNYPQVHQLITTVQATLRDRATWAEALKNAFPMGSMTGAPKIKAMQLIEQYERTKRGLYSGAVGYITPTGDFDFNVVIRSILYNAQAQYLSFQVGSAITYDALPTQEYEECLLKASAIIKTLEAHTNPIT